MNLLIAAVGLLTLAALGASAALVARKARDAGELRLRWLAPSAAVLAAGLVAMLVVAVGYPKYRIWQQEQEGAAELAKAEQNRQIAIQEARAKEEAARSLANAEVIRAEGVAKANKIIGDSLQNNDAYIHYLWIEALKESRDQVIYVPTEAGIPVTESARFVNRAAPPAGDAR